MQRIAAHTASDTELHGLDAVAPGEAVRGGTIVQRRSDSGVA